MTNVWFLWNPELVRPVWIAGMSILQYLNLVSFVLLCPCFLFVKGKCNITCGAGVFWWGSNRNIEKSCRHLG